MHEERAYFTPSSVLISSAIDAGTLVRMSSKGLSKPKLSPGRVRRGVVTATLVRQGNSRAMKEGKMRPKVPVYHKPIVVVESWRGV
jgi:hypothetical protein